MNQQLNYEPTNQAILRRPDDITDEGAFRLAEAILKSAYKDYTEALKTIMKYRNEEHIRGYEFLKLQYAYKQKKECEGFYKSNWFVTLTLGKTLPGEEVIKKIQKTIGYIDLVESKVISHACAK